jgi:hypothetical protein
MVKSVFSDGKGLVQSAGSGVRIENAVTLVPEGLGGAALGTAVSAVNTGAGDKQMTVTQPANTVLVDVGVVLTTAIAGSSGNINVKVGTADDGAQICALGALMSSATAAAIGTGISVQGLTSEGEATLSFVANSALHTATERTIHIRAEQSATVTAGVYRPFIRFIKLD